MFLTAEGRKSTFVVGAAKWALFAAPNVVAQKVWIEAIFVFFTRRKRFAATIRARHVFAFTVFVNFTGRLEADAIFTNVTKAGEVTQALLQTRSVAAHVEGQRGAVVVGLTWRTTNGILTGLAFSAVVIVAARKSIGANAVFADARPTLGVDHTLGVDAFTFDASAAIGAPVEAAIVVSHAIGLRLTWDRGTNANVFEALQTSGTWLVVARLVFRGKRSASAHHHHKSQHPDPQRPAL